MLFTGQPFLVYRLYYIVLPIHRSHLFSLLHFYAACLLQVFIFYVSLFLPLYIFSQRVSICVSVYVLTFLPLLLHSQALDDSLFIFAR